MKNQARGEVPEDIVKLWDTTKHTTITINIDCMSLITGLQFCLQLDVIVHQILKK